MADQSKKRASVFDSLKAGQLIVAKDGKTSDTDKHVAAQQPDAGSGTATGALEEFERSGLEPAAGFGDDPDPDEYTGPTNFAGSATANGAGSEPDNGERTSAPRGRASPNYGTRAKKKANLGVIEKSLKGIHAVAAVMLNNPVWSLTEQEAKDLAAALGEIQSVYGLEVMDEKTEAWINLIMVAGAVYGPRIVIPMMIKQAAPKEEKPKAEIVPMRSGGTVQPRANGKDAPAHGGAFTPSQMMPPGWGSGAETPRDG